MHSLTLSKWIKYTTCPKAFEYYHIDRLEPIDDTTGKHRNRGTWLHALLEAHYGGGSPSEVQQAQIEEFGEEIDSQGIWDIFASYVHYYSAERMTPVALEQTVEVTLPEWDIPFRARIDMIAEQRGKLWVIDHKTYSRWKNPEQLSLNPTAYIYIWLARKAGYPVEGFMWNMLNSTPPKGPQWLEKSQRFSRRNVQTTYPVYVRTLTEAGVPFSQYRDQLTILDRAVWKYDDPSHPFFRRYHQVPTEQSIEIYVKEVLTGLRHALAPDTVYPRAVGDGCLWCAHKALCGAEVSGGASDPIAQAVRKHTYRVREEHQ